MVLRNLVIGLGGLILGIITLQNVEYTSRFWTVREPPAPSWAPPPAEPEWVPSPGGSRHFTAEMGYPEPRDEELHRERSDIRIKPSSMGSQVDDDAANPELKEVLAVLSHRKNVPYWMTIDDQIFGVPLTFECPGDANAKREWTLPDGTRAQCSKYSLDFVFRHDDIRAHQRYRKGGGLHVWWSSNPRIPGTHIMLDSQQPWFDSFVISKFWPKAKPPKPSSN